ncbi:T9SS type A sorting domain-containing protein [Kordia sp. YSTF-M3]|uniref:T9SS type A sorting domain-containing protein n=1 Tax=Kordia aestuariivivens TaxID=2759037 RepID=A0ABR7QH00_9FLAO|nr:delta-60 repeat domain-containing protein [Kordia aestuariivivens]MBC8757703.1 T9SS type A sorting domain-containing protein [Kordia aestuariivivens]
MRKITFLIFILFAHFMLAQDGTLDGTFGANGYVLINQNNISFHHVLQADGKILYKQSNDLRRLDQNGSFDSTFGVSGAIALADPGVYHYDLLEMVTDNKITVFSKSLYSTYYMARYNFDGSVDTTLGSNGEGYVTINLDDVQGTIVPRMSLDNKILLAGNSSTAYGNYNDLYLRKYNFDGTDDPSANYRASNLGINFSNSSAGLPTDDFISDLDVMPNGKMIVSGRARFYSGSGTNVSGYRAGIIIVEDGVSNSLVRMSPYSSTSNVKCSVTIDNNDIYMVTGVAASISAGANPINKINRWDSSGNVDYTFGTNGILTIDLNIDADTKADFSKVLIQPDGKMILAGKTSDLNQTNAYPHIILARFLADGTLDTTFNSVGYILHDISHPTTAADKNTLVNLFSSPDFSDVYISGRNLENSILLKYANPSVLSTNEVEATDLLTLYPNPSKNEVFIGGIDLAMQNKNYSIADITGRIVKKGTLNNSIGQDFMIDVSMLSNSLYFLNIEGFKSSLKFIKE